MPASLDFDLVPIYRQNGQDGSTLPGLRIAYPPRRVARSRAADLLIVYLATAGSAGLAADQLDKTLSELASVYFDTAGPVTTALRTVVDAANNIFLKRRSDFAVQGQQATGLLTLASLRGDQLFMAQSGPVYALWISSGRYEELYDPQLSGRGLGSAQTSPVRYFHASLQPNDALLIASRPAPNWEPERLTSLYGQDPEFQKRRLLHQVTDAAGVLVRARPGTGKAALLAPAAIGALADEQPIAQPENPRSTKPLPVAEPGASDHEVDLIEQQALADEYQPLPELEMLPVADQSAGSGAVSVSSSPRSDAAVVAVAAEARPRAPQKAPQVRPKKDSLGRKAMRGFVIFLNRIFPEQMIAEVPNSIMAAMAILVPLVIVATATAIYFRRGLAAQSEQFYAQAAQAAQAALVQSTPIQQREALISSLAYLDLSDSYRKLPEAHDLRLQVANRLDELDLVKRLDYQPAIIGGLPSGVRISRMVLTGLDLYMLDSQSGKVLRAFYSNQGYQLDPTFQCGPGEGTNVGPLVDMRAWPAGIDPPATVVAMDAQAVTLFCSPGNQPGVIDLANPPNRELSSVAVFTLDLRDLYLFDLAANGVWVYWSGDFNGEPAYYFGDQVPSIQDVIDLAANNEELYLLHSDGRITLCITGSLGVVTPTRCDDPVRYLDTRPGRENAQFSPEAPYSQILYSPPPDPSLFMMEPTGHTIDRFSLRNLAFQRRYLPAQPLPSDPSTAFFVDPVERLVFLATGNRVYYASLP